ncbi:MAG: hypothetical protein ACRDCT_24400, partial [Shewanella sp.]
IYQCVKPAGHFKKNLSRATCGPDCFSKSGPQAHAKGPRATCGPARGTRFAGLVLEKPAARGAFDTLKYINDEKSSKNLIFNQKF